MRDNKTVEAQIARFEAERVASKIKLIEDRISRARIVAPIDGTVVEGDIKKLEGRRTKLGDVLFRVAPLADLRADLSVEEDQIADVLEALGRAEAQGGKLKGELSTVSHPNERVEFAVERVNPVAEVVEGRNVFKVRVRPVNVEEWMRPGMEGVARISIDRRRYAWIWTRKLINWVRMKLWL
jgi:multidrug efflux pump subunit AcrA (membrane-fusion protein)